MSNTGTGANDDPKMTTITLEIPESFLDDPDATWRAEDFPSRSEFIKWALRDTVKHPSFSRKSWKDIAASEHQLATGEGRTYGSDEIRARLNEDTDGSE
jgi:Arc/MetJ-type ribon-helix-helix transcriptional regulator